MLNLKRMGLEAAMLVYNLSNQTVSVEQDRIPAENEVVWIRLFQPAPEEVKHIVGELFQGHPLLVEDCINLNQRPKMDRYKNQTHLVFFAIEPKKKLPLEMDIVIGQNYVITIHKDEIPFLEEVYTEFQEIEGRMQNPGEILYHILDRCVDEYVIMVNHVEDQLDWMERGISRNPNMRIAKDIFSLKRVLHQLRRIMSDEKTIMGAVSHQNMPYTVQEKDVYFIDIYDHISRVIDSIDIFRDSLSGLLELQMAIKSDRMNEIMKTLTIISSIFLPLTFIVGLYGMNFHNMPELNWKYGYLGVIVLMVVIASGLIIYYRRRKWM
jgi:magnesium transporter